MQDAARAIGVFHAESAVVDGIGVSTTDPHVTAPTAEER